MISDRAIGRLREAAAWPALDARYEITGVAGHGGMGTVYEARDHVLDRDVAVKVLDVADQKGARAARLRREAHILARLDHPGIVPVHDAGALDDGRTLYVDEAAARRPSRRSAPGVGAAGRAARYLQQDPRRRGVCARAGRGASRLEAGERDDRPLR
ncbi:MAG: Serine/threonine-protein kinase PknD [Acidobacteriota bacterium]